MELKLKDVQMTTGKWLKYWQERKMQ